MHLFAEGWRVLELEERIVNRYARPKALWEVILERAASGRTRTSG